MDSITHIVLGAVIGEALAGRQLGKKALVIGAIANSLPDIDFLASFFLDTSRDVWFHRSITHSFLFVILMTLLMAWLARRVYPRSGMTLREWLVFFGVELGAHIFIDAFNAYGTGWFEPFSHYRISFHVLFVADPLYSVWLGIAALVLVILRRNSPARGKWVRFGLVMSSLYLCYCLFDKWQVNRRVAAEMERQQVHCDRWFTTPTPFNSFLWYVVGEDSSRRADIGYWTGYLSVFDSRSRPMAFRWQSRGDSLLRPFIGHGDVGYLLRFAQGYYSVDRRVDPLNAKDDTLEFNVLRFGEMRGWEDPRARFVFHYFLQYPEENGMVVQRGRFAGWDREAVKAFVRRMWGD